VAQRWVVAPSGLITPHWGYRELACRHCNRIPSREIIENTARWLETVRHELGDHVMHALSGARCATHNRNVGGAKNSYHVKGWALDFVCRDLSVAETWRRCLELQERGIIRGLGYYPGRFVHIDRREGRANWEG
jgi:uncharacterized protein YcbK (DUF882 family)